MTPEFYAFLGIAATSGFFFIAYFAWDSMKSYVSGYVHEELKNAQREIYQEMDERERGYYDSVEHNQRSLDDSIREIERSIDNMVSPISE